MLSLSIEEMVNDMFPLVILPSLKNLESAK